MPSQVDIRPARPEDRDQVRPLAEALATSYELDRDAFGATFAGIAQAPDVLVLVAESEGQLIGYLLAQRHHTFHANGTVLWVEELFVDAAHRQTGVGRRLMSTAEEWGRSAGTAYVALATRRAAPFYEALGYEASATYFKRPL